MPLGLFLFFFHFLPFTLADVLWGCEPSCQPPVTGSRPQIVSQVAIHGFPISIENLTKSLTSTEGNYGLLILESGSDFNTQWLLASPSQSVGISGLASSKTPSSNFIQLSDGVYSIGPSLYVNSPKGIVIVSPTTSLSYKIESSEKSDCEPDGLLFAVIPWDDNIQSHLSKDISFLIPAQCPYCSSLLLSDKFIRICPIVEERQTLPTRSPTEVMTPVVTITASSSSTATTKAETTTTSTATSTSTSTVTATSSRSTTTTKATTSVPSTPITSTSTTTTTSATTTIATSIITTSATSPTSSKQCRAVLRNDLKGFHLVYDASPMGIVPCEELFPYLTGLGNGPKCTGDGKEVDVSFGLGALLIPGETITVLPNWEEIPIEAPSSPINPDFFVDHKKVVMSCEKSVKFAIRQITGIGDRNATFQWSILGEDAVSLLLQQQATDAREMNIPTEMIRDNITMFVSVCNFVGKCTSSGSLKVTVANWTEALVLDIEGIPEIVYPSMAVKLEAVPMFVTCEGTIPAREALYRWTVNGSDVAESSTYRIPSYQYSVNDVVPITLTTSYKDPVTAKMFTAEASTQMTYTAEPLIVTIDAARRTHPEDVPLLIDASASRDPNTAYSTLQHSWKCLNMTSNQSCHLPIALNYHSAIFEIPGGALPEGGEFLFTNEMSSSLGKTAIVSSLVKISSPLLPSVTIVPLSYPKQSIREYIRLLALVSSEEAPMNVSWEVVETEGYGFFQLKDFISGNNINFHIPSNGRKMLASLTIPPKEEPNWEGLSPDTRYLLRITATNPRGSSSADVELLTEEELPEGIVEVSPTTNLTALSSEITFRLGDGWHNLDHPISYRFGYRILQLKNESTIEWLPHASVSSVDVILPSGESSSPSCSKRIGFTGLIEACDRSGACRLAESAPFYVAAPLNITLAESGVVLKINDDFVNGKHLDSIQKILALEMELCTNQIDSSVVDRTAQALLDSLSMESEISEWKEVMEATTRVLPSVSDDILSSMLPALQKYQQKMGLSGGNSRVKRDTTVTLSNLTNMANETNDPEEVGSQMLQMCDLLFFRKQNVVDLYLLNINNYLSLFCTKLDAESTRIMQAGGGDYTTIRAQTVNPNLVNFLNKTYQPAGDDSPLHFLDIFPSIFKEWNCGNSFFCNYVCLGTARFSSAVFQINPFLEAHFFPDKAPINLNHSVSPLHKISIIDPTNGNTATSYMGLAPLYSIQIPIIDYLPTNYYMCYMYSDSSLAWDVTSCTASNFATKIQGINYITCTCSTSGFLGVFTQAPPPPPSIWLHSEVRISFQLNTTALPTEPQMKTFKDNMAISGQSNRLVDWMAEKNNGSVVVNVTLRPPFKPNQVTSSYALQSIFRIVDPESGFVAFDGVKILSSSYEMIQRELTGDGNARKIIVRMLDKLYPQVVGNKSDTLATTWINMMADALRISSYRFKNAGLFVGIFFNVTITKPFEEEKYPLSAEEISLMLVESTKYKEIQVVSASGESINLPEILLTRDVVELRVIQQQNPLVTILIIAVSSGVLLTSLYIGGAIVVKIRTDRCLEEERRRMVTVDPADLSAPPRYREAVQGSEVIRMRHR